MRIASSDRNQYKLVLNFALGSGLRRPPIFSSKVLRHATRAGRFQITTDGFAPYRNAIPNTLEDRVDFAHIDQSLPRDA